MVERIGSAGPGDLRETGTGLDMDQGTRDELLGRLAEAAHCIGSGLDVAVDNFAFGAALVDGNRSTPYGLP